ncbi:MAG: type IX secretion system sortase PorU [Bacteroidia bacterium]|nr:type IX secretion system sortase PorU [Bacteroidia bacterium]
MKRILMAVIGCVWSLASLAQLASNSVLKEGTWYKIGVTQSGICKIDAGFLSSMGLNPASIDPRTIRIYGNGGAMLPQANIIPRLDDLQENPIYVEGEGDGAFGSSDYLLFYAEGPHVWAFDTTAGRYVHRYHLYSDTSFYYLTVGTTPGLRIQDAPAAGTITAAVSGTRNFAFRETEIENVIDSGRYWLGDRFDQTTQRNYTFYVPDAQADGQIRVSLRVASRSDVITAFQLQAGSTVAGSVSISTVSVGNKESRYYEAREATFVLSPTLVSPDDSLRLTLVYDRAGSSRSEGWLDWIELEYDQRLDTRNNVSWYASLDRDIPAGEVAGFSVQGGSNLYRIWDITDPVQAQQIPYTLTGTQMDFSVVTRQQTRLVAFKAASMVPVSGRRIDNQNLHGLPIVDYLIISPQAFVSEAERLADFHRSHYGRSVAVVTPQQIFNEFSSGKQDPTAIRDFIRMFYLRSDGLAPGYVLMFGDGTYIYKNLSINTNASTNYLLTYQSRDSWDPTDSYVSDDFFVLLEEKEGFWGEASGIDGDTKYEVNTLDAAIGRLPVEDLSQAKQIVDKIIFYAENPDGAGFGQWRNRITLVADHKEGEGNTHVRQANGYTNLIEAANPCVQIEKIYMDSYPRVITAAGDEFPAGREALLTAMDEGALIMNYTGHGGENAWSNSYIFENSDIPNLKNKGRYPALVTATCEYGRYDDPVKRSGAELMTMEAEAGAIALFTTVRLVYSSPNETLNQNFYRNAFSFDTLRGRMIAMGDIMRLTKNATFVRGNLTNINSRNFTLLGDPGLILNYPQKRAVITSINGNPVSAGIPDTLRSLGQVTITGEIQDEFGQPMQDFGGDMDITVYDKPSLFKTILSNYSYYWQKNRIFNGTASVNQGAFSFDFVVPIDISYEEGKGKITVYFYNQETDGIGCQAGVYIGGTDPNAVSDTQGPDVRLFINDTTWVSGGITSPNPYLYALVQDPSGINTIGAGIGHEITAVLDGNEANTITLNNFYSATQNSYQQGSVRYPLRDLAEGRHTLRIRVWDVANNASEDETEFWVADDARMALDQVLSYPNPSPAGTDTWFRISHNQDGKELEIGIEILAADGRVVKTLSERFTAGGNNHLMSWDGLSENGRPISPGLYIYRVVLRDTDTGQETEATRRHVLIR